jgi:hypothetical protein
VDELALRELRDELLADVKVAETAWQTAELRFTENRASGLEGCAHHLARLYNIIEQMALRVVSRFENRIAADGGWHAELIGRLAIRIEGVRPALFPAELRQPLRELRGFRHVFTHAYDLELDPDKLKLLLKYAAQVAPKLRTLCDDFIRQVAAQEGLDV